MAKETSKSLRRRWCEDAKGDFQWEKIFKGRMLDIGPGDDPIPFGDVTPFDKEQGDANHIAEYFPQKHFDLVHGSNVLEHLNDPVSALYEWIEVTKNGGYVVATFPCMELYGDIVWPSKSNPDHKATFSMGLRRSGAPVHIYVPEMVKEIEGVIVERAMVIDTNYDYSIGFSKDQTWIEENGVEAWIELVLKKV